MATPKITISAERGDDDDKKEVEMDVKDKPLLDEEEKSDIAIEEDGESEGEDDVPVHTVDLSLVGQLTAESSGLRSRPERRRSTAVPSLRSTKRRAASKFHTAVFVRELLIHLFFPLSFPLAFVFWGKAAWIRLHNSCFLYSSKRINVLFQWLNPLVLVALAVVWSSAEMGPIHGIEVVVAGTLFVAQKLMVSSKFAFMPRNAYEELLQRHVAAARQKEEQLIVGWYRLSLSTIKRELSLTASALGIQLHEAITLSEQTLQTARSQLALFRAQHPAEQIALDLSTVQDGKLTLESLLIYLLERSNPRSNRLMWAAGLLGVSQLFLPLIVRASAGLPPLGSSGAQLFVALGSIYISSLYAAALIMFLAVGVTDYRRRYRILRRLALTTVPVRSEEDDFPDVFYLLDLSNPDNVVAWVTARRLLAALGRRYFQRIQLYTSGALALGIALGLSMMVQLLMQPDEPDVVVIVVTTYDLVILSPLLLAMLFWASRANLQVNTHRELLVVEQMSLLERRRFCSDADEQAALDYSNKLLSLTAKFLKVEHALRPVRFLGVEASFTLMQGVLAGALSAIASGLRLLTG